MNMSSAWQALVTIALTLCPWTAEANIPSAYFACEGAQEQEECQVPGPRYGNCVLDTLCTDPENTEVNECLLCVDGCWGRDSGGPCRRFDGTMGVCEQQSRCTTDPEKSFNQCNRCVRTSTGQPLAGVPAGGSATPGGTPNTIEPPAATASDGCSTVHPVSLASWLFVLLAWGWQRRGSAP